MQDKIFELILYGAILLIGFSLGRLWIGRKVAKKLAGIKELIDDWQKDRAKKFDEIDKSLAGLRQFLEQKRNGE